MLARLAPLLFLVPFVFAQTEVGELRLTLADASGLPVQGTAELASQANQYVRTFTADAEGHVIAKRLFLGDNAAQAISATSGVFPVSQDERNAIRARTRCDLTSRLWLAFGGTYDSGLPIDFSGTYDQALDEYGLAIVRRIDFAAYRTKPLLSLNASLGVVLSKSERYPVRFQIDGTNLTDRLNLINFAGLFSGTAIAVSRSVDARLQVNF